MPRAFKGYPCLMKLVTKTTALVLLMSLLSGCSSSDEKACEAAEISRDNYNKEARDLQVEAKKYPRFSGTIEEAVRGRELSDKSFVAYELSLRVILTYPNCFTPEQVVEAQQYLDKGK
jgi:hypothetical protein